MPLISLMGLKRTSESVKSSSKTEKKWWLLIVVRLRENMFSLLSDLVVAGLSLKCPLSKALGLNGTSLLALHKLPALDFVLIKALLLT